MHLCRMMSSYSSNAQTKVSELFRCAHVCPVGCMGLAHAAGQGTGIWTQNGDLPNACWCECLLNDRMMHHHIRVLCRTSEHDGSQYLDIRNVSKHRLLDQHPALGVVSEGQQLGTGTTSKLLTLSPPLRAWECSPASRTKPKQALGSEFSTHLLPSWSLGVVQQL